MSAPEDVLPGVVPVEMMLARLTSTVVMLTGMRAFPIRLQMNLAVRVRGKAARRDLHSEVFDGPYSQDIDAQWQTRRLKWGVRARRWSARDVRRSLAAAEPGPQLPRITRTTGCGSPTTPCCWPGAVAVAAEQLRRQGLLAVAVLTRRLPARAVPMAGPGHLGEDSRSVHLAFDELCAGHTS